MRVADAGDIRPGAVYRKVKRCFRSRLHAKRRIQHLAGKVHENDLLPCFRHAVGIMRRHGNNARRSVNHAAVARSAGAQPGRFRRARREEHRLAHRFIRDCALFFFPYTHGFQ